MSVRVADVCSALEDWVPSVWAYEWDRCGLQTGAPDWRVRGVLTCLTVTPAAFERARKAEADFIVSHHPLIWDPLTSLCPTDPRVRLGLELAQARIACYSAHTSLDVAPGGVNELLAGALGLQDRGPLHAVKHALQYKLIAFVPETHLEKVRDALSQAGAGAIGAYTHCSFATPGTGTFLPGAGARPFSGNRGTLNEEPEHRIEMLVSKARLARALEALRQSHPYEEPAYDVVPLENRDPRIGLGLCGVLPKEISLDAFAVRVREALQVDHVRVAGPKRKRIKRVAVMGGAGGGDIGSLPDSTDAFVTGDVRYHDAMEAMSRDIAVIDAGHAGTEKLVVPALARFLRKRFPKMPVTAYLEPGVFRVV